METFAEILEVGGEAVYLGFFLKVGVIMGGGALVMGSGVGGGMVGLGVDVLVCR